MKFGIFKEFKKVFDIDVSKDLVISKMYDFFGLEFNKIVKELNNGLTKLEFVDNFESFQVEVSIAAGTELTIRNQLRNAVIPSKRIIVRGNEGSKDIVDGDTEWNVNNVYLKNVGVVDATATVIFMK